MKKEVLPKIAVMTKLIHYKSLKHGLILTSCVIRTHLSFSCSLGKLIGLFTYKEIGKEPKKKVLLKIASLYRLSEYRVKLLN